MKYGRESNNMQLHRMIGRECKKGDTPQYIGYNAIQYNTKKYKTIQYKEIQNNTMKYNTIHRMQERGHSSVPRMEARRSPALQSMQFN